MNSISVVSEMTTRQRRAYTIWRDAADYLYVLIDLHKSLTGRERAAIGLALERMERVTAQARRDFTRTLQ